MVTFGLDQYYKVRVLVAQAQLVNVLRQKQVGSRIQRIEQSRLMTSQIWHKKEQLLSCHPKLVWLDLEMTGLDPDSERIIEIATIVTNFELNEVVEGPNLVIHQPNEFIENMDNYI